MKHFIIEYLYWTGFYRLVNLAISTLVYAIFLKRLTKLPVIIGAVPGFIVANIFPFTITVPFFYLAKAFNFLFTFNVKTKRDRKLENKEVKIKVSEDAFKFSTETEDIIMNNPYRGTYIQGGAGSGKSVSIIYPILKQATQKNFSGLLYDFKSPELSSFTIQQVLKNSTSVTPYFVDFKEARRSVRINPLNPSLMTKTAYAHEYSQTLLFNLSPNNIKNENYFMIDAKSVLTGIIWYLKKEYPQYCTLPHIIALVLYNDINTLLEKMADNIETKGLVASLSQAIKNNASKQVAGVVSTLQANLSKINTPDIFWILSGNDIDLDVNDPNNPKFICLGNESTLAQTYAPIISLIISVAAKQMNQPNKHKSIIVLDEAPTLYIPNFEQIPATARSNKVATVYGAQDFSQLVDRYQNDKAQVILSNMGNQFFGRTVNKNTATMITQMFGRADKKFQTRSKGDSFHDSEFFGRHINSSSENFSETIQERDRVKTTDIMNLEPGEFYGLIAEGNKKEILKSKFKVDREIEETDFEFELKVSEDDIQKNYVKIIEESASILHGTAMFQQSSSNDDDLIKF
ncbi:type IV secretion system coupling TraD/TrwB family protein [Tenacibaculum skagerrakense]|uniref:Type IV secretion system coupling TraD/TrwB family protein n=1 Tax=Tenacibaculum skagerrakense TaxID=186571 RepID=A0A4R2P0I9_9FLAO|nr:type IV secretion system DNA-binding domain-containing protein [Tenacibaculum skagerrakense]TCP28153.1 type IV secretion system coupling TraD/TrwB family protein [Tenacibaculum skagerrakense]